MTSPPSPKPVVWFPDTSALVTMAVHEPLQAAVVRALSVRQNVLMRAVVDELDALAGAHGDVATWATTALGQLEWLGEPVRLDDPVGTDLALRFQEEVAAGRPLSYPGQHYGEAAIVAAASRAQTVAPQMLSDDYDARVLANNNGVRPVGVLRLLHIIISAKQLTADEAAAYVQVLTEAGRVSDYTAEELRTCRLGRAGRP